MAAGILSQRAPVVEVLIVVKILPMTIWVEVDVVYFVKPELCTDWLGVETAGPEEVFDLTSSSEEWVLRVLGSASESDHILCIVRIF